MRVHDNGSCFTVVVSRHEVDEFNRHWPCSTLRGRQRFEFDKRNGDGNEAVALSEDARRYGETKLGIKTPHFA